MGDHKTKQQMVIYVEPEVHRAVRVISAAEGKTASELVESCLKRITADYRASLERGR